MIQPAVVSGRWLQPDDDNTVVLNTAVLQKEPGLKVGDELTEGNLAQLQEAGLPGSPYCQPAASRGRMTRP